MGFSTLAWVDLERATKISEEKTIQKCTLAYNKTLTLGGIRNPHQRVYTRVKKKRAEEDAEAEPAAAAPVAAMDY